MQDSEGKTIITPLDVTALPEDLNKAIKTVQRYAVLYASQRGEKVEHILPRLLLLDATVPLQWSGKSNHPYYKEVYAIKVRTIVDLMQADQMNRKLLSADFRRSKNTLHSMMVQGWQYLNERMDTPEGKYKELRDKIMISKITSGVLFEWKNKAPLSVGAQENVGEKVQLDYAPAFKEELIEYLETGPDESKFEKTGLRLTPEHIEWIRNLCIDAPNIFIHRLNGSSLVIAKSSYASKFKTPG